MKKVLNLSALSNSTCNFTQLEVIPEHQQRFLKGGDGDAATGIIVEEVVVH